jgi:DNA-binding NarL/FixJ family response regulator
MMKVVIGVIMGGQLDRWLYILHKMIHGKSYKLDLRVIVATGLKYITAAVAQELAQSLTKNKFGDLHAALSNREYQTLIMIGAGQTVTEIAEHLSLSVKTISMYRSRLLLKMSLRNNAELTHYALRHQLVPDLP